MEGQMQTSRQVKGSQDGIFGLLGDGQEHPSLNIQRKYEGPSLTQKYDELHQTANVTKELQTVLRIRWLNPIKNEAPWKETGQERITVQIRKRKWSILGQIL